MKSQELTPIISLMRAAVLLFTLAAAPSPVLADPIVTALNGLSCAGIRYGGNLNCNAGEFAAVVNISHASSSFASCTEGGYFILNGEVSLENSNATRYNVGFFTGENSNDPRAMTGQCSVATFPTSPDPWFDADGNACGDFKARGTSTPTINNLRVDCVGNAAGQLLVPYVVSYQQNLQACTGPTDVRPGSPSKCNAGTAVIANVVVLPKPTADYRLDETSWNGTGGEVKDSSENAMHGTASGGAVTADTTPAISGNPGTCRYGTFDGSNDQIVVPHNAKLSGSTTLTYTAWVRPTNWSGVRQIMSKSVHGGGAGRAQMGLFSESGVLKGRAETAAGRKEISTTLPTLNAWTHVALVFDGTSLRLYTGGVQRASTTFAGTSLIQNSDPFTLGNDYGRSYFFSGAIDEARVYTTALNAPQVAAVMNETHPCTATPTLDHLRILHDGAGLTCAPEQVTLQACKNADCSESYTGSVTASLSPTGWVGGDTITFSGGSVTTNLRHTTAESVTLGATATSPTAANATRCFIGASESCAMTFAEAGFIFDVPTLTANKTSANVTLSAVKTSDTGTSCAPAFTGARTVNFWSTYANPATGTAAVSINGTAVGAASPGTGINLTFDANAQAQFTVHYPDAGLMQLDARYTGSGADAGLILTGNDQFVVKPVGLCVQSTDANADCASGDHTCTAFKKAGENFNLTVKAVAWEADPDTDLCSGNAVTPNFRLAGIGLNHALVAPAGGQTGSLGTASFDFTAADNGVKTVSQSVSEVGVFTFGAAPVANSYFGETVNGGTSAYIGRFYPAHFLLTPGGITDRSAIAYSNPPGFTYMDETFRADFTLTARSIGGTVTQNYQGAFARFDHTLLANFAAGAVDTVVPTPLSARLTTTNPQQTSPWSVDPGLTGAGESRFALDFSLARAAAPDGPYTTLTVGIAPQDGDGVLLNTYNLDVDNDTTNERGSLGSTVLRHGRLMLGNAHGSELLPLAVPLYMQYFDGSSFVRNPQDNSTTINLAQLILSSAVESGIVGTSPIRVKGAATTQASLTNDGDVVLAGNQVLAGDAGLLFSAPGTGGDGYVDLTYTVPPWANFDWDGDGSPDNPSSRITFGIYKGSPTHIYLREQY